MFKVAAVDVFNLIWHTDARIVDEETQRCIRGQRSFDGGVPGIAGDISWNGFELGCTNARATNSTTQ